MSKILIYKPCWKTLFVTRDEANVFINPEVVKLVELLSYNGHKVAIASSCDIPQRSYKKYDAKILVSGRLYKKGDSLDAQVDAEIENIKRLFDNSTPQFQVVSDWKISAKNGNVLDGIDFELLTQTPKVPHYVEYEKLFLFHEVPTHFHVVPGHKEQRTNSVIYIGNPRSGRRNEKLLDYSNSGVDFSLYGPWDKETFPQSKGPLKFKDSRYTISKHQFALCISEKAYEDIGHRTPRIWEVFLGGSLAMVDENYPIENGLIDSFQFVKNGDELREKIDFFNLNPQLYNKLLQRQYKQLKREYFSGEYQYKLLKEAMKL